MDKYEHLKLPIFEENIARKINGRGGPCKLPQGRDKKQFSQKAVLKSDEIKNSFEQLKNKFHGSINPNLIFEIEINQSVSPQGFENELERMGIHVLSVAENKKGYWIVFSDDIELAKFKEKLAIYGKPDGANYDFFNAIESFQDISIDQKIGQTLKDKPLEEFAEFIDIELWPMLDRQKNVQFIGELKNTYKDWSKFRITDQLITKSFVLIKVKLTKAIFDEIIELKEIARADRPFIPQFNPYQYQHPDIDTIEINPPNENAAGILIIDSGIISNHPLLEKCVGGEENFQEAERETHDTVGHGTAVAGCAAYGDIENCLKDKVFSASNWIFSAKVMYKEKTDFSNFVSAVYDEEKLIEHQLKDAVESFVSNPDYHIRVVNISFGNDNEVCHKDYSRQLPLASLIDELAFDFPNVVFIVSAGNQDPLDFFETIEDIKNNYPTYLIDNPDFKIINPATAALALTVGSIAHEEVIIEKEPSDKIKIPIAEENQPSPFTRTGAGINGMVKPELVEYGGNLILYNNFGSISEDKGGKIALLNNKAIDNIIQFSSGTSFSAPKLAHLAGKIANHFPHRSALFIKNMMLMGAKYPLPPNKDFYSADTENKAEKNHLNIYGFGLSDYDRAINSYNNRTVLWDESKIGVNKIKVYSLQLPEIFFTEKGKKTIIITLTFNPETRSTRGDSYLGNRMEFHLFHSINPQTLVEKYGVISGDSDSEVVPEELKRYEINDLIPGGNIRKAGCHQKAWKEYKAKLKNKSPISLVLLNFNKWIIDPNKMQDYCISVTFEHEKEIELYNAIKLTTQVKVKI